MEPMEIILLIAGGLIFILSFFISDTKTASGERKELSKDEAERLADQELAKLRGKIDMLTQEVLGEAMERTKRSLEKLSNEKIMAVNEYSDTVLTEIHKNHEEAMFLYDMLNNKHTSLKNAIGEINRAVKDAEAVREAFARPAGGRGSGRSSSSGAVRVQWEKCRLDGGFVCSYAFLYGCLRARGTDFGEAGGHGTRAGRSVVDSGRAGAQQQPEDFGALQTRQVRSEHCEGAGPWSGGSKAGGGFI